MRKNIKTLWKLYEKYCDKLIEFLERKGFILHEEKHKLQEKENQKLLEEFVNWLFENKGITSEEDLSIHAINIDTLLFDLLKYENSTVFAMNDENLLSFILNRSIRKRIVPRIVEQKLLESLTLFFEFLEKEYNMDLSWAKRWCTEIRDFYHKRLEKYYKRNTNVYDWQMEFINYMNRKLLFPPRQLDKNLRWGDLLNPIESLLLNYYMRLLNDFVRKIDPNFTMPYEEKYQKVIKFQQEWAKTPIPELDNKTPIELIKLERKLRKLTE